MPAQHSNTAEIIFASCSKRRPTLTTHKLFREPKRGFRHHYAKRALRPDDFSIAPPQRSGAAPIFTIYGWPLGHGWFIRG